MAKRFAPFGTSSIDRLVADFLHTKGIDYRDIVSYRITRSLGDIGTIEFSMHFEDAPPVEKKEASDG